MWTSRIKYISVLAVAVVLIVCGSILLCLFTEDSVAYSDPSVTIEFSLTAPADEEIYAVEFAKVVRIELPTYVEDTPEMPMQDFASVQEEAFKYIGAEYDNSRAKYLTADFYDTSWFSCANYVSYVLYNAGEINKKQYTNSASYFANNNCFDISPEEARPGDLVMFSYTTESSDPRGFSHIGLYIGDAQMIHAGTANGVAVVEIPMEPGSRWGRGYLYGFERLNKYKE